jgi:alkane 1-monooxygenase
MSLLLVGLAYLISGWPGTLLFIASGLCGKALLEIVNYMEHYGLLRDPHQPVQPRHSWNSNKRLSSWAMFNLTRHSHHHAQGELPYTALQPMRDAPLMLSGYLSTLLVTLLPPLWHRLMAPRLLDWDRQQASATERQLAAEANARSGIAALRPASSRR